MLQILNQESLCRRARVGGEVNGEQREGNKINCFECRHFIITHEPAHPYGCQAMGFKSREMPSAAVASSSGEACLVFESKARPGTR
jgi:hypothetical protein